MKMKSLSCCMVVLALLCWAGATWSVEPAPAGAAAASVPALPGLDQPTASATPAQSPLLDFLAPLTPPPSPVCTCTPNALQCTNTCIIQGGPKCVPTYRCSVGCIATCLCNGSGCL